MNLQSFLYDLNNLVPSINFSLEVEQQNCSPFLDVLIIRKEDDFLFNVYRESTNICSHIHFYSNHSMNVKKATFSGMFLRALRVCSDEFLEDEINFIFDIEKKHKYPMDILGKACNNALKTFNSHTAREPFKLNNILLLPFHENFVMLVHVFKMYYNINFIFKNTSTLNKLLINNIPAKNNSCI